MEDQEEKEEENDKQKRSVMHQRQDFDCELHVRVLDKVNLVNKHI